MLQMSKLSHLKLYSSVLKEYERERTQQEYYTEGLGEYARPF